MALAEGRPVHPSHAPHQHRARENAPPALLRNHPANMGRHKSDMGRHKSDIGRHKSDMARHKSDMGRHKSSPLCALCRPYVVFSVACIC